MPAKLSSSTLRMLRHEAETSNFGNQIVVRNQLSSQIAYFMLKWADAASPAANDCFRHCDRLT